VSFFYVQIRDMFNSMLLWLKGNKWLTNKYTITTLVFLVYFLFLDDVSIGSIFKKRSKIKELSEQNEVMKEKLIKTKEDLRKLYNLQSLENYARTEKFFKKPNEEIFVITNEPFTKK